jgi:type I restriction enzyme M protein
MASGKSKSSSSNNSANIGFEAKLWLAADKLRSNMDAQGMAGFVLAK